MAKMDWLEKELDRILKPLQLIDLCYPVNRKRARELVARELRKVAVVEKRECG